MQYFARAIEQIIDLQERFLYLEPIFSFEEMSAKKFSFSEVRDIFTHIVKAIVLQPRISVILEISNLGEDLAKALRNINEIQKGLEAFLWKKRYEFARFCFVSNELLIQMLAEVREPGQFQPFIQFVFENISELIVNSVHEIIGLRSTQRDELMLKTKVSNKETKGTLEKWIKKLEDEIYFTMVKLGSEYLSELASGRFHGEKKYQFTKGKVAQLTLASMQVVWVKEIEVALGPLKKPDIVSIARKLEEDIRSLCEVARCINPETEQLNLHNFLVQEISNRDVLQLLDRSSSLHSFEWLGYPRHDWRPEENRFVISVLYSSHPYCYEYLSVFRRLAITPLTDRVYRSVFCMLDHQLSGALLGPHSSGKSETLLELSRLIAIPFYTFRCFRRLNFKVAARMMRGVCAGGFWACFEEFGLLDSLTISVVAQQLQTIQRSKARGMGTVRFDDGDYPILTPANIFMTLRQPGPLPEQLQGFRIVHTHRLELQPIVSVILTSNGFREADKWARIVRLFLELARDFVDPVLLSFRQVKPIVLRYALSFLKEKREREAPQVKALLAALIPETVAPQVEQALLELANAILPSTAAFPPCSFALKEGCEKWTLDLQKRVGELKSMLEIRKKVVLVGQTMTGKTTAVRLLSRAC